MKAIMTILLSMFVWAIGAQIKPINKTNRNLTIKNKPITKINKNLFQKKPIEMCSAMDLDFPPALPNAVVILPDVIWNNGAMLKVAFISSSDQPKRSERLIVESKVKKYAKEWEKHANIKFQFTTNSSSADIRIGMDTTSGWWSKIGTDAKNFTGKTMNYGWKGSSIKNGISDSRYKRTILHEFGHALGLKHEHQNPEAGICWDWDAAIKFYNDNGGWTEERTRGNLEALSTRSVGNSTRFDSKSIMIYGISNDVTSCDFEVKRNSELSSFDKIGIGNIYPNRTNRHLLGPGLFAYSWTPGWDNVEVIKIRNVNYLFMLKSKTGDVHIHRLNQNGSVGTKVFDKKWTSGWTTVRVFKRGTQHFLFLLKKSTGDVHIHKFNNNGTVGARVYDKKWTSGWSIAEFYNQGANGFLYLRKTATGKSKIFKVNVNGTIGSQIRETNGTPGWSLAKVFQTNFKKHLFLYRSSTGEARVYELKNNGLVGTRTYNRTWTRGWTTSEFKGSNHQQYIFLMKYKDGKIKQNFVTASGTIGDNVFDNKLRRPDIGWSAAKFFTTSNLKNYVLLMNKKTGAVVINKVYNN